MNHDLFQTDRPAPDQDPLIVGLNSAQAHAVQTTEGPLLVLAGAGSGKTRVITHRIAYLVQRCGVKPWQILAVTFSNKAAGEMRHRIEELLGADAADLWLGTFHRIGVRLLRSFGKHAGLASSFGIYDRDDSQRMIKRSMAALDVDPKQLKPRTVASYMDSAKNNLQLPGDDSLPRGDRVERRCAEIYQRYEDEMRRADAVDFGDLLMRPVQVLRDEPALREHWGARFRYVLVDEFQDTNHAQYELLRLLTATHGNLCVVGDDDQSIYSWRGAQVKNILDFPKVYPTATVVKLEQNYRSTDVILQASGALVRQNRVRHDKTLWTATEGGDKIALHEANTDSDEADWIARQIETMRRDGSLSDGSLAKRGLNEVAIFYRTNAQSRVLEEALSRFRLPYVLIGGLRFYERAEVKDLLAYCRLVHNADDTASWLRAINTPRRGIGKTTVGRVEAVAAQNGLSVPDAARLMVTSAERFRGKDKLAIFVELLGRMRSGIEGLKADAAGTLILKMSGLKDPLEREPSLENQSRLENLVQLLSAMSDYAQSAPEPTLAGYLEQVALVTDVDRLDGDRDVVSMMTMHAAKGLEYDVTFVCGLEDGIMPHGRGNTEQRNTEEERRLLYVAMTRARKRMHLSYARMRWRFGEQEFQTPSPFLTAIPSELLERKGGRQGQRVGRAGGYGGRGGYGGGGGFGAVARVGGDWSNAGARRARPGRPAIAKGQPIRRDDGSVIEPTAVTAEHDDTVSQRDGPMETGSVVQHKTFGRGQVLDVAGYGKLARVTVRFSKVGVKKVLARFLQAK